jgi:hypothetical protein
MDRIQLEKMRDEKRAELKLIEDMLSKPRKYIATPSAYKSQYKSYKSSKTYKSPPSGKTWYDWIRFVVQSNHEDMLLATLGTLASNNGFVLEEGDKFSNFVSRIYGIKLYMSDEDNPRMFVTVSDKHLTAPTERCIDKHLTASTERCIDKILNFSNNS